MAINHEELQRRLDQGMTGGLPKKPTKQQVDGAGQAGYLANRAAGAAVDAVRAGTAQQQIKEAERQINGKGQADYLANTAVSAANNPPPAPDPQQQAGAVRAGDMASRAVALGGRMPTPARQPTSGPDPQAQAGAILAQDMASRAVDATGRPVSAPLRPRQGMVGPQAPSLGSVLAGGPGAAQVGGVGVSNLPSYRQQPEPAAPELVGPEQPGALSGAGDVIGGGLRAARGAIMAVPAYLGDKVRQGGAAALGGELENPNLMTDFATGAITGGAAQFGEGVDTLQRSGRQALGLRAAQENPGLAGNPAPAAPAAGGAMPGAGTQPAAPGQAAPADQQQVAAPAAAAPGEWGGTGIGTGAQGGEIVGRVNADGVAEFSNMGADQTAAEGRQYSAAGLRARGNSGSGDLSGSAANVGRGLGSGAFAGISGGEAGDAQTAIARFERANAEREGMVGIQRQMDAQRGLTGVRGISEGLSKDPVEARRQLRDAQIRQVDTGLDLKRQDLRHSGENAAAERGLRAREVASTERRDQLEGRAAEQELVTGELALAQAQRLEGLRSQLVSEKDPQKRTQLQAAYNTLLGSKDRYMEVRGGTGADGSKMPSMVFDTATGDYVGESPQQGVQSAQPRKAGMIYTDASGARAKFLGGDQNDPNNYEEV
ncbi:MAG TPA: hypothetical protein VIZ86_16790 [Pseudomonas sp.]